MVRTKFCVTTCKVLLGTSLAFSGLNAVDIDVNGENTGNLGSFSKPKTSTSSASGDYIYNNQLKAGETANFVFNYTTSFAKQSNKIILGINEDYFNRVDFNTKDEKVNINVGAGSIKLEGGQSLTDPQSFSNTHIVASNTNIVAGLNNFTLTGAKVDVGRSITGSFFLKASNGESTIKGDASFYYGTILEIGFTQEGLITSENSGVNGRKLYTFEPIIENTSASLSINGNLDLSGGLTFFNGHLLNPNQALINVSKNVNLGTLTDTTTPAEMNIGIPAEMNIDIPAEMNIVSNRRILSFDKAKLISVSGSNNTIQVSNNFAENTNNLLNAYMVVDSKTYFSDLSNKLNNISTTNQTSKGITAISTSPFPGNEVKEVKFQMGEVLINLSTEGLVNYSLSMDKNSKNLYISGGATAKVLDNRVKENLGISILKALIDQIGAWDYSELGPGVVTTIRSNVDKAYDMLDDEMNKYTANVTFNDTIDGINTGIIEDGKITIKQPDNNMLFLNRLGRPTPAVTFADVIDSGLFRLGNNIYVTDFDSNDRVNVARNNDGSVKANAQYNAYQLVANKAAYDALKASNAPDKTALDFTRNDIFAQNSVEGRSVTGVNIKAQNQNIVARYLDNLENKIKGRTNSAGELYEEKDLHTQDVGEFKTSKDGGRTGLLVDKNGKTIAYDNSKIFEELALIKFTDGFADALGLGVSEAANSIANANSAISSINSVINIASDVSINSRIAMLNNPYGTYALKYNGLKFANIASDITPNYVDSYTNGFWANVFGGINRIGGNNGGIYGLNLGLDKAINDNVLLGAFFTYANAEIKDNYLRQKSNNFQLGIYSNIQVTPLWGLNLKAFGQLSPTDQNRGDTFGDFYDSTFKRKTFGLNANIGRAFNLQEDTFIIKPFVGANYYLTYTPKYSESGNGNNPYSINKTSNSNLSLELGAEFRKYFNKQNYFFIIPKIEQYLVNNGGNFTASLAGFTLPNIDSSNKKKIYGQAIIGGNFNLRKNFSVNANVGIKQILANKVDNKGETYAIGQLGFEYKF